MKNCGRTGLSRGSLAAVVPQTAEIIRTATAPTRPALAALPLATSTAGHATANRARTSGTSGRLSAAGDGDPATAFSVLLHERKQAGRIRGLQPNASMRSRPSQLPCLRRAMDCVTTSKEDGVRHRRVIIFTRKVSAAKQVGAVSSGRRSISTPPSRYAPRVPVSAVDEYPHCLTGEVYPCLDARMGWHSPNPSTGNDERQQ